MTVEKILGVMDLYKEYFKNNNIPEGKMPDSKTLIRSEFSAYKLLKHCHWMLGQMEDFIVAGLLDKVQRWLGYIQGVPSSRGIYSLDALKHHSMTGGEAYKE